MIINYSMCIYSYADSGLKEITMKIETSSSVMRDLQGSDSNWEKIRQEVTCVICCELFEDPKSMPCLHTYCKKCLMEAVAKRPHDAEFPRDRPAINCPLCRAEVPLSDKGIEELPTNFSAARIVETVQLQDKLEKIGNHSVISAKKVMLLLLVLTADNFSCVKIV